jgi:all-trans-retinol dehydrogenase (NAD+)
LIFNFPKTHNKHGKGLGNMTDFRGKNVLITGAASGIGRLLTEKIADQGGQMILWDVNREGLTTLEEELKQKNVKVSTYVCNLSDREAIYATAEQVHKDCGPIDILINNAGIVSGKPLTEASDEEIIRTFDVNTLALFWTTRAFLPNMVQRNSGHLVTIASAAGLVGTARLTDYCASKFGAVGYAESMRMELKRQKLNIRTTMVCPYYINTGMFEGAKTRFSWLLPILEPEYVADKIINAILKNHQRIVMPRFVLTSYLVRVLPVPIFDAVMSILGVSRSMDEFTGRPGH